MSLPMALAALIAPLSITTNTAGAAIEFPATDSSGSVILTLAEGVYTGVGVVQNTRMYNSQPVGPTIRVTPGQTFSVTVANTLPAPGFSTASLHNRFKSRIMSLELPSCARRQL